jgi:hypothetical protein
MVMFKPVVDFFARARPGTAPAAPEAPAKK